jgi:cysteate synthase
MASCFEYSSQNNISCLIIIPTSGLNRMQFIEPLAPCVKIVTLTGFTDYYDAIVLASRVAQHSNFILEGGVKNVGRRDGLGTTLLSAVETIGQLPDYYFQAVGSGEVCFHTTKCDRRRMGAPMYGLQVNTSSTHPRSYRAGTNSG